MKRGITIGLAVFGLAVGYGTSLADWKKVEEAGLGFTIAFVVSMLFLIGYNASVSEGTDIKSERVLVRGEYFIAAFISGVCACILPYIIK